MFDSPRKRRFRLLPLAIVVVAIAAGGVLVGRATVASQPGNSQVATVLSLLAKNYYRPVNTNALVNDGLEAVVASLHDPYSHYFPAAQYRQFQQVTDPHDSGIGVEVLAVPRGLEVSQVFPSSPAAAAGLARGDVIVAVGSRSLAGRSADYASNLIRGPSGTRVTITYARGRVRRTVEITRQNIVVPVVTSKLLVYHGVRIGYLSLAAFTENAGTELRVEVDKMLAAHARALILDLRSNGGGLLQQAVAVASIFIPDGTIVSTRGRAQPTEVFTATGGAISTAIPMAVLVNADTASSAEIVTGALQDHRRATVVGTHTFGKGVFQEIINLPGGAALDMTVGEYFTPNGHNLGGGGVRRGAGIEPNVYVPTNPNLYPSGNPADPRDRAIVVAEGLLAARTR